MAKKINVLCFSPTGTTEKIACALAKGINENYQKYNITLPSARKTQFNFAENDLVIFALPVYSGRIPGLLTDFLQNIRGQNTKAVFLVVYGNRDYEDALLELKNIMEGKGFLGIAGAAFVAEHSYVEEVGRGRPDEKDIQKIQNFAMKIREKLNDIVNTGAISSLSVKGNFPYKERRAMPPIKPQTDDQCISCGICAENCPTGAIDREDYSEIDGEKCIRCFSCIKKCPVEAKTLHHELVEQIIQMLLKNCSNLRQEPDVFI